MTEQDAIKLGTWAETHLGRYIHDPGQLRRVAAYLVGRGGEYTACGRFLEHAIEILFPNAPKPPEKEPLTFEKAYGSQTMPGR